MSVEAERGYLIIAQNNSHTDYIGCACVLARSIKALQPDAEICLLSDQEITNPVFDFVRTFPFGDRAQDVEWKLHNDWQCFYASPFRETIKLEADMILPVSIQHWFDICCQRELVVTIGARNYLNDRSRVRTYRKIFDENHLPDVYNAITYWRRSNEAREFFDTVREIFENWPEVMALLKYGKDQPVNTDLAYAIAMMMLGPDRYILPGDVPGIIHMKSAINGAQEEDWTREFVWEKIDQSLRINTVQSLWPVHYHIKDFARKIDNEL